MALAKTVCVADASGHTGKSLVRRLLRRGYTVHAATQAPGDHVDSRSGQVRGFITEGLSFEETERLNMFTYDAFDYRSIVDAIRGCYGLFYSFEPPHDQALYDEYTVDMEVRTAHNVLEACALTMTMDKVVFTSSATAVIWKENRNSPTNLDERNWSDPNFCRKFKLWHALAKTLAEKTAWALAMDRDVAMVSINSGLVTTSDLLITNPYLKGAAEMYQDGVFVTVDAEFLADAHVCVYEDASSFGRYLCFDNLISLPEDAVKFFQMFTPPHSSSPPPPPAGDAVVTPRIHNRKISKLMMDFHTEI